MFITIFFPESKDKSFRLFNCRLMKMRLNLTISSIVNIIFSPFYNFLPFYTRKCILDITVENCKTSIFTMYICVHILEYPFIVPNRLFSKTYCSQTKYLLNVIINIRRRKLYYSFFQWEKDKSFWCIPIYNMFCQHIQ